jgi:hypothetical protein
MLNSIYIWNITYTSLVLNLSLEEINKLSCKLLEPEDANSEHSNVNPTENNSNKDVISTKLHNGRDTSFMLNFELNPNHINTFDWSDKFDRINLINKIRVTSFLHQHYFDKNITLVEWEQVYDTQFYIFERLYKFVPLNRRLAMMDIFANDLVWNNYLSLNKIKLRQIAELKNIADLEAVANQLNMDITAKTKFKYLNYNGGLPTLADTIVPRRNIKETFQIERDLEKLESKLCVFRLVKEAELKKTQDLHLKSISESNDRRLITNSEASSSKLKEKK